MVPKRCPNYLLILLKCINPDIKISHLEQIVYFKEGERIITPDNPLISFFTQ